jgi:hypothetical protein
LRKIDGQVVTNAATRLRLTVTEQDVRKGVPKNPNACAIAVAAMRQIPGCTAAKVHKSCLFTLVKGKWQRRLVPEYATRELVAFDRGGRFVPGEFEFDPMPVPTPTTKRRRPSSASASSGAPRRKRTRHVTIDVRDEARADEPRQD